MEQNIIDSSYKDAIGGIHDSGLGWDPNGHFCGECRYISCADCKVWRPTKAVLEKKVKKTTRSEYF